MSLSEITRDKVRQRAENGCEYCLGHQNYILGRLQTTIEALRLNNNLAIIVRKNWV